jgi:hypothetical protein
MKFALNVAAALTLCAFLLTGIASAQSESDPAPTPEPGSAPVPGIIITPPRAPSADTQQSCPLINRELELIV